MKKLLIALLKKEIEIILSSIIHEYKIKLYEKIEDKPTLQIAINLINETELVKTIVEKL